MKQPQAIIFDEPEPPRPSPAAKKAKRKFRRKDKEMKDLKKELDMVSYF